MPDNTPIWRVTQTVQAGDRVQLGTAEYEVGEGSLPGDVLYLIDGKLRHWPKGKK